MTLSRIVLVQVLVLATMMFPLTIVAYEGEVSKADRKLIQVVPGQYRETDSNGAMSNVCFQYPDRMARDIDVAMMGRFSACEQTWNGNATIAHRKVICGTDNWSETTWKFTSDRRSFRVEEKEVYTEDGPNGPIKQMETSSTDYHRIADNCKGYEEGYLGNK